jgi:transcriptional regulator with XRE-family HTH domain
MDSEADTIGRAVRRRRRQLGITQQEAADRAQLSLRAWNQIERGHREGRDRTIAMIEEALTLPPRSLLALRAEPPKDPGLATIRRELVGMINELTSVDVLEQVRLDIARRRLAVAQAELARYEAAAHGDTPGEDRRTG